MIEISEEFIEDIETYEKLYEEETGKEITKLSYWNAIPSVSEKMLERIPFFDELRTVNYIFSYEINQKLKEELLTKFGCSKKENDIIITPSGSLSIYNVVNFLKQKEVASTALISPVYFTVPYVCENLSIPYINYYLSRNDNEYYLDNNLIKEIEKHDVIWITNPVYTSSVYYSENICELIEKWIAQGRYVILDESLCLYGMELIRKYYSYENVISICSPHKSLCINGNKFSGIIISKNHSRIFNAWVDIISGCLSISNLKAIYHFLSVDYDNLQEYFNEIIMKNYKLVELLCVKYKVDYDRNSYGCFMSLYFPDLSANLGDNVNFIKEILLNLGVSFIPGSRNHMNSEFGFSFRINLSRVTLIALQDLEKLIIYLSAISSVCSRKMFEIIQ